MEHEALRTDIYSWEDKAEKLELRVQELLDERN